MSTPEQQPPIRPVAERSLWFTVPSGPAAGEVHLAGWWLTAVGSGPHDSNPYYALAGCPLCGALVANNAGDPGASFGTSQRLHENWHADNDYPRPEPRQSDDPAPTRAEKIAAVIVPDQLDQYLPAESGPSRSVARRLERSSPDEPGPSSPSTYRPEGT